VNIAISKSPHRLGSPSRTLLPIIPSSQNVALSPNVQQFL
jgi:hypothetical protein